MSETTILFHNSQTTPFFFFERNTLVCIHSKQHDWIYLEREIKIVMQSGQPYPLRFYELQQKPLNSAQLLISNYLYTKKFTSCSLLKGRDICETSKMLHGSALTLLRGLYINYLIITNWRYVSSIFFYLLTYITKFWKKTKKEKKKKNKNMS